MAFYVPKQMRNGKWFPFSVQVDQPFTTDQLHDLRLTRGMKPSGTKNLIAQWKKRGFIRQMTDDSYDKLKYFTGTQHGTDTDPNA